MSKSRNINEDVYRTSKITKNNFDEHVEVRTNWLGHSRGAATIDKLLMAKGATLEELSECSGRHISSIRNHFYHLEQEHGLKIVKSNDLYFMSNSLCQ